MKAIVIGAGILGASAAYHLARDGVEVVVVDGARAGRATAAGAGIICPWDRSDQESSLFNLLAAGAAEYPPLLALLAEDGEADTGYVRAGALVVSTDAARLDMAQRTLARAAQAWPEVGTLSLLTPEAARRLFPPLDDRLSALHVSGGARVDGRRLAAGMIRAAERRGARVVAGDALLTPEVMVGGETLAADVVVAAAGAWLPELLGEPELRLAPQRGQIVHLHLPDTQTHAWPVVLPESDHYLLAFDDRVVIGATRETGSGFDHRVTAGGLCDVLREGLRVAPGLARATLLETRIGFRPLSADGLPLLGWWRPGLIVGSGLGPVGLTCGPLCGRLLAELALGREPAIDLDPFRPDR